MMGQEIRQSDCFHASTLIQLFESPPGLRIELLCPIPELLAIRRPMYEIQIQVINPKFVERLFARFQGVLVATLGVPQFAGHKQLVARYSAITDSRANCLLIAVHRRSVDVPVPGFQGFAHCCTCLVGRCFERPVADAWDCRPVR